jgi:hypothetical protein
MYLFLAGLLRETDQWPWKCCDRLFCPLIYPRMCTCRDVLESCGGACQYCEEEEPSRYVCLDMLYVPERGEAPRCNAARTGAY